MIRNFFRHVLDSLKNLRRNGWMTIAAISSVTITLSLVGIFLSVILNTANVATDIENNVRINAYIKLDRHDNDKTYADPKDKTKQVENKKYHQVYDEIKDIPDVEKISYSSKEDQLTQLTKTLGKSWETFQGDANPLYDVYIVEVKSPDDVKKVAKEIDGLDGIEKAEYGGSDTEKIFNLAKTVRTWGFAGALLLLVIAVFLISNTIRITILSRSREIQIMSLVGAKKGYIRWPFFLEGAWVGLLGAILPSILINFLYDIAYESFTPALLRQNLTMIKPAIFVPEMIGLMALVGVLIGSLGSILSMRRFLKI